MQKLLKHWPWLLAIGVIFAIVATILGVSIYGFTPKTAAGETTAATGWLLAFWSMVTGGTAFSIPALIAFIRKLLPASWTVGTADSRVSQAIDAAQIAAYMFLLSKSKSADETAALLAAGRASCDALRDGLFPMPAAEAALFEVAKMKQAGSFQSN